MSTFNPTPGEPYGQCKDCDVLLETQKDSREHMSNTRQATETASGKGRSHTVTILNPSREERIRNRMDTYVERAIEDLFDDLERLARNGEATYTEIKEGLFWHDQIQEAWADAFADELYEEYQAATHA